MGTLMKREATCTNWKGEKLQRKTIGKSGHLEIHCQGTVEGLALFGKKVVIRVALQVCANMKMRKKVTEEG